MVCLSVSSTDFTWSIFKYLDSNIVNWEVPGMKKNVRKTGRLGEEKICQIIYKEWWFELEYLKKWEMGQNIQKWVK